MENTKWLGVDTYKNTLACYSDNNFKEFKTTEIGFKNTLMRADDAN